ncbi:MAG: 4Fe-4S binding protein [bacterium]
MKKIVVISGKGGTGKTTISAALAHLAARDREIVMADCDIDASNLPVLLPPEIEDRKDFIGSSRAVKTKECSRCGRCAEVCRFGAINSTGEVNLVKCEGCGSCVYVCPDGALEIEEYKTGTIFTSRTRFGPMIHAELERGEEASGKIVIEVKKMLVDYEKEAEVAIIDGSPGTGCPVIASLRGCDGALVVTVGSVTMPSRRAARVES